MRKLILLASAAAMAAAMPALAKPGKGGGHANGHPAAHAGGKGKGHAARPHVRTPITARDRNGNGIADVNERRSAGNRYGVNGCPPGLAKKGNGCLPPGQARKIFAVGQRIPNGYQYYTPYEGIPLTYRQRYNIPSGYEYIYRDQSVYVVNPRTNLVTRIFELLN